jgi:uncharacterized protein (UPF0371 family)
MTTLDTIDYKKLGFDNDKYLDIQGKAIQERINHFSDGKLYLEVGGKFLYDPHAARVLHGFDPENKKKIFKKIKDRSDIFFCINAKDIKNDRQLKNRDEKYTLGTTRMIKAVEKEIGIKPKLVFNLCDIDTAEEVEKYREDMIQQGYITRKRYLIEGYPEDTEKVLSDKGYGADDYVESDKNLIIVIGAGSNSGKMSTCLGQVYNDKQKGIQSGYAKYETFPIWNLALNHPVNLAYEAATADIGDYNVLDKFHWEKYNQRAVNYNRDLESFDIIIEMIRDIVSPKNFMTTYHSPTDMGISHAGHAITDDEVVCIASYKEILRRKKWYQEVVDRGKGVQEWVDRCDHLAVMAEQYISERDYRTNLKLD